MKGKDGTIWNELGVNQYTKIRHIIDFHERVGPTFQIRRKVDSSALSAFYSIIDFSIITISVLHTNAEAKLKNSDFVINETDILVIIAVLYSRGVFDQKISLKELWSTKL